MESYELCCLVEVFPNRHKDLTDFLRTLKFAYLYAKTVTLGKTHWSETNKVLLRNRRIGCSLSGIQQFIGTHSLSILKEWMEAGYERIQYWDRIYSNWLCIPLSIKTTSIKPSGTVSLLAGATPGMHWPQSRFYIRRVRLANNSNLLKCLTEANYHIEPVADRQPVLDDNKQPILDEITNKPKYTLIYSTDTSVVEFPIDNGVGTRGQDDVSMWEQGDMAAFLQLYWADNQVSCTVTFDQKLEGPKIKQFLDSYQYKLKGVSLLPRLEKGAYEQMPYETITEERYNEMMIKLKPISFRNTRIKVDESFNDRFCDSENCLVVESPKPMEIKVTA